MEYEKIIDLIHEIESSSITDFALQKGEFRISIKKEGTKEPKAEDDRTIDIEERGNRKRETQEQDVLIEEGTMIRSPLVGVFHAAKTQDGEAQVAIGSHIDEGQILEAIEAMKLMNDVVAACSGTVAEVLGKDGDLVEYGQPLFVIEG